MARERMSGGTRGWVVGRAAGAPVVVSPGWLLGVVLLTYLAEPRVLAFSPELGAAAYLVAAGVAGMLFVSVFLHELGHALVARRHGVVVHELAVTLLGGHTRMAAAAPSPGAGVAIAVAGPAVNLALAAAAWAAAQLAAPGSLASLLLGSAALTNGFVGVFNLLPGLPLDGGRVLEAVVWKRTGRRGPGTVAAGWVGRVLAVGVILWAVGSPLVAGRQPDITTVVWAALLGSFLWSGGAEAIRAGRSEQSVERVDLAVLTRPARAVPIDGTVASLGDLGGADRHLPDAFGGLSGLPLGPSATEVVLVAVDGSPVAYLDRSAVQAVPPAHRAATPLHAVAVPLPPGTSVPGWLTGAAAVQAVGAAARTTPVMAVVDQSGRVVGLLRAQDVISALRAGT